MVSTKRRASGWVSAAYLPRSGAVFLVFVEVEDVELLVDL